MLGVAVSLTAGSLRYDTHTLGLTLRRGVLPIIDRLEVSLPAGVRFEAAPDDDVALDLDGGEGAETVFTGTVTAVTHEPSGPQLLAHGGARRLARYRPSLSLEQVTVGDVAGRLCDDAGVEVAGMIAGPTLARYVATARSTALEELVRLLHLAGASAAFGGDGALAAREGEPAEERALLYGREIRAVRATAAPAAPAATVIVGEGAGDPGSPQGLWHTSDFWAGGAPAPGPDTRRRVAHELRTTGDAETAGAAWGGRRIAELTPVLLRCWLVPAIGPDDLVQIQDAPDHLPVGAVRVREVVHRVDPAGHATTELRGYDDGAASAGLLGALAGLAGSLL